MTSRQSHQQQLNGNKTLVYKSLQYFQNEIPQGFIAFPPPLARRLRRFYKGLKPTKTTIKNITENPNKPYSFIPTTLFQINLYGDNQCHTHVESVYSPTANNGVTRKITHNDLVQSNERGDGEHHTPWREPWHKTRHPLYVLPLSEGRAAGSPTSGNTVGMTCLQNRK